MEVAGWFVGPIMNKIIKACSDYLVEQVGWRTGMKKKLERLRENHPKIQAVVFAANQAKIIDQTPGLKEWIWQLRDAVDEANDVLDEFEYMKLKEQLSKNIGETKESTAFSESSRFLIERARKIGKSVFNVDPNLKRLEAVVKKLGKVSADVSTFLHLIDSAKLEQQEQQRQLSEERETGSFPTNDLIGRGKEKERVMEWLRKSSNEHRGTTLYGNISLLCIVGHGDMLECLNKKRPRLETLVAFQGRLEEEVMSKKFLLVLDDIWEEDEENRDIIKWEKLLSPLAHGNIDSKILVTTRMDSVAMLIEKVITKKVEIVRLEGLEEDKCLLLLKSYAFAGLENRQNPPENLRDIAGEMVKKLLGFPLAAKVIGGVLSKNLDESHWRKVLENNLLDDKYIHSILRLSYIFLPNPLQNCFAFCCKFPQYHLFNRDDLLQMWISLGFIQPSQGIEDIGERYFDVLLKKALFDKVKYDCIVRDDYKMHDLIHESASKFFAQECVDVLDDEKSFLKISETIRHLSVLNAKPYILSKIEKFKHLHSLFLFYKVSDEDICSALTKIFEASTNLWLLYVFAPYLKVILEEIGNLKHLRYLKIVGCSLTMLPRSLSNLYHLQYIIYDSPWENQPYGDDFLPDIKNLTNLRHINLPEKVRIEVSPP
ncbi:putative disease resistance protein RGA4 [Dendrobium catenatum]|uniref:putative disease resistance protein RGA4 n=1 Tax=Dendrobium catenatum TaxID=906689 RepID=UPI00109F3D61|nr:putative disease resistance protein RGA4 [Dendrobium catenatum]